MRIFLFLSYSFGIETMYVHPLQFPRKLYPIPDQNGQSVYPFSDQNGPKTLPDGAAHTDMAYMREYPPGVCRTSTVVLFSPCLYLWLISNFLFVTRQWPRRRENGGWAGGGNIDYVTRNGENVQQRRRRDSQPFPRCPQLPLPQGLYCNFPIKDAYWP